jgi:hypothetical protein
MIDEKLDRLRDLIQRDPGRRGLARDPVDNLLSICRDDFRQACRILAALVNPSLGIVTGFFIPRAEPPAAETDGPLGALFLARALVPLGVSVTFITESYAVAALKAGLAACDLARKVRIVPMPGPDQPWHTFLAVDWPSLRRELTHLLALERVGPAHSAPDRCHNMRGDDITSFTAPAHLLFEEAAQYLPTIGIGDGGNEIGMGRIPWDVIRRNIPGGDRIACRVATDFLIVAGVSNWGAYALAAGFMMLREVQPPPSLFDPDEERRLLQIMVDAGPLVDGTTTLPTATVDGLDWDTYAEPLRQIEILFGD